MNISMDVNPLNCINDILNSYSLPCHVMVPIPRNWDNKATILQFFCIINDTIANDLYSFSLSKIRSFFKGRGNLCSVGNLHMISKNKMISGGPHAGMGDRRIVLDLRMCKIRTRRKSIQVILFQDFWALVGLILSNVLQECYLWFFSSTARFILKS